MSTNGLSQNGDGPKTEFTTLQSLLQHWTNQNPDKTAFVFHSADPDLLRLTLTRKELLTLSSRFAARLRAAGIKAGEYVCNTLPNGPERLITGEINILSISVFFGDN